MNSRHYALCTVSALLLLVASAFPRTPSAQPSPLPETKTRLVLLGTAGGPSAKVARAQPANAVIVNDDIYIVDAGDGIVRQMALGGYPLPKVRAVFITHHHSDHNAGYGPLLLRAWMSGRRAVINTFGPAGLEQMTADYFEHMQRDIELRITDGGLPPVATMIDASDIEEEGLLYEDENVRVRVFAVDHGAANPAYGYRFDTGDRSIVFSGDTRPHKNVIEAAKGADVLVHEIISIAAIDAMIADASPGNQKLRAHLLGNHTTPAQLGEIASAAGVQTLVLSHFGGTGHPEFDRPEVWEAEVRKTWPGALIVGEDLMVIE